MIKQIIFGIIGIALGFVFIWQNRYIVDHLTGRNNWAESALGGAGTYSLIKIIGLILIFISLLYMTGFLNIMIKGIWGIFFKKEQITYITFRLSV